MKMNNVALTFGGVCVDVVEVTKIFHEMWSRSTSVCSCYCTVPGRGLLLEIVTFNYVPPRGTILPPTVL